MPISFDLVVCITSTALFDCSESHNIWKKDGVEAYKAHQSERVNVPLPPGVGFRLVHALMKLNQCRPGKPLVDVILVSRNDSTSGERVRNSLKHYELEITRMSFTGGVDVVQYLPSYGCDLFLTTESEQVDKVLSHAGSPAFKGIAAGLVCNITGETTSGSQSESLQVHEYEDLIHSLAYQKAKNYYRYTVFKTTNGSNGTTTVNAPEWPEDQVRFAFDGDGVLFSDEAERVFKLHGLEEFRRSEQEKEHIALADGPMHSFALKLQKLREALGKDNKWRIRTFLVTARDSTTNERALKTLKKWGLEIDETHFLGGLDKTPFLIVIDPAIFFDDSSEHINRARPHVPAAHIMYGILNVKTVDGEIKVPTKVVVPDEMMKETRPSSKH